MDIREKMIKVVSISVPQERSWPETIYGCLGRNIAGTAYRITVFRAKGDNQIYTSRWRRGSDQGDICSRLIRISIRSKGSGCRWIPNVLISFRGKYRPNKKHQRHRGQDLDFCMCHALISGLHILKGSSLISLQNACKYISTYRGIWAKFA